MAHRIDDQVSAQRCALMRYKLDASQSSFTVQAFAGGFLAGFGHNPTIAIRDFTGEVQFVPGTLEAFLRLSIKATALHVTDDVEEGDKQDIESKMLKDVLEADRYPEIVFQSTNITVTKTGEDQYRARIIGDLTLHGVQRTGLWIPAQVAVSADSLRARGEFTLKQTDYKIKLVSVAGGAIKLKDELKFAFDILARQEEG